MRMCNEYDENYQFNMPHQRYDCYEEDMSYTPLYSRTGHDFMNEFRPIFDSTAAHKKLSFDTESKEDPEKWQKTHPREWTPTDSLNFILTTAESAGISCYNIKASAFSCDGNMLLSMLKEDFEEREPTCGKFLYEQLHKIAAAKNEKILELKTAINTNLHIVDYNEIKPADTYLQNSNENFALQFSNETLPQQHSSVSSSPSSTDSESESKEMIVEEKPIKRPPGRPPSNKSKLKEPKKTGRLWEFLRDLLKDPRYCPALICWENHDEGVFRFVKSEKVAKIWGTRKGNEKMNYEKLSRAMRYYYKSQVLQPVLGRKLVYKFGPNAKNWQSDNPNFQNKLKKD